MSPRRFPDLPCGDHAVSQGMPGWPAGRHGRPGTDPALPAGGMAGSAEGGTGRAPMGWSRSAAGGEHSPRPPVRRTQASPVPAVPASGMSAREESPGAVRQPSGTSPAQDPAGDARAVAAPSAGTSPAGGAAVRASAPLAGSVSLDYAVICAVCGTVPCASMAEADKRAGRHTEVTRHPTVAKAVAA